MRWLLAAAACVAACGSQREDAPSHMPQYARLDPPAYTRAADRPEPPRVSFADITTAAGLDFQHETGARGSKWLPEAMGSGCALFDYDGDGWLDALLINGHGWQQSGNGGTSSRLYRNQQDGTFTDVTTASGWGFAAYGMGVTVADYDADGDADVYLTCVGANRLMRNDSGRFTDVAPLAGVAGATWRDDAGAEHPEWSTGAAWVDVDRDGWPDLVVANYVQWSPASDIYTSLDGSSKSYTTPEAYAGLTCRLFRNLGDGTLVDATAETGLLLPHAKSMSVAVTDFEPDGWPDLVITNDTQPNFLLSNNGDGTFTERGLAAGIGYDESGRARAGMGVDVAALGHGETLSIAIGNFSREPVSVFRQTRGGAFTDAAGAQRLLQPTLPTLTFGLRFLDYDLDGRQDLMLANGHIEPDIGAVQKEITYAQPPQLFWNDGDGHLLEVSSTAGPALSRPRVARGLCVGDIDNDGDLDLLLSTNGGAPLLLRNDGPTGTALALDLGGSYPALEGLGAMVTLSTDQGVRRQRVRTGSSYLSHSPTRLHFGLGAAAAAQVQIIWPDGTSLDLGDLAAGRLYEAEQGRGVTAQHAFQRAPPSP
jgi:enediyne biosynthesis protein E4